MPRDYYRRLGLARDATFEEIRRAFRKLAPDVHPDTSGEKDDSRFKAIEEAHAVLSDKQKRAEYDDTGGDIFPAADLEWFFAARASRAWVAKSSSGRKGQTLPPEVTPKKIDFGTVKQDSDTIPQQIIEVRNTNANVNLSPQIRPRQGKFWGASRLNASSVATIAVTLEPPESLAPGAHTDTLTVYWQENPGAITKMPISVVVEARPSSSESDAVIKSGSSPYPGRPVQNRPDRGASAGRTATDRLPVDGRGGSGCAALLGFLFAIVMLGGPFFVVYRVIGGTSTDHLSGSQGIIVFMCGLWLLGGIVVVTNLIKSAKRK